MAKIPCTLVNETVGKVVQQEELRIVHYNGVSAVGNKVKQTENGFEAVSGTVSKIARILMRSEVNLAG